VLSGSLLTSSRYDAIMHAPFELLPQSQFDDGGNDKFKDHLFGFRARAPELAAAAVPKIMKFWEVMGLTIEFGIEDLLGRPNRSPTARTYGSTTPYYSKLNPTKLTAARIKLTRQALLPLLGSNINALNEDEILVQQFFVAKVVSLLKHRSLFRD
jgi:hypothetical protein